MDESDESELDELDERVDEINRNTVGAKSRRVYLGKQVALLLWLDKSKRRLLNDEFVELVGRDEKKQLDVKRMKDIVLAALPPAPLHFDDIKSRTLQRFIISLNKRDGSSVGSSTHNTTRSAIHDLYRSYDAIMPPKELKALEKFFKGLKRTTAKSQAGGEGRVQVGKTSANFAVYRRMATEFLKRGKPDDIFSHAYMVLSWNLICRAGNTESICFSHLEWIGDALGVYFAHMKNDQAGERPRDPRHVYANPLDPIICPILALGIYLMAFPLVTDPPRTHLFAGGKQYSR